MNHPSTFVDDVRATPRVRVLLLACYSVNGAMTWSPSSSLSLGLNIS